MIGRWFPWRAGRDKSGNTNAGFGRTPGKDFENKVALLESHIQGPIKAFFHENRIFAADRLGLIGSKLEPLVFEPDGKIVEYDAGGLDREGSGEKRAFLLGQLPMAVSRFRRYYAEPAVEIGNELVAQVPI